jgi:hypothetical protein
MELLQPEPFTFCVPEGFWRRCARLKARKWKLAVKRVPCQASYGRGRRTLHTPWPARLIFRMPSEEDCHDDDVDSDHADIEIDDEDVIRVPAVMHIHETLQELQEATAKDVGTVDTAQLHVFMDLKHRQCHFRAAYPVYSGFLVQNLAVGDDCSFSELECTDPSTRDDTFGLPVWNAVIKAHLDCHSGDGDGIIRVKCRRRQEIREFVVSVQTIQDLDNDRPSIDSELTAEVTTHAMTMGDDQEGSAQAALLNLQLMTWRFAPGLDLDKLGTRRFLILGCGTLGCNLLRTLVAWGGRRFALVDNGAVGLGTSARQSLMTAADAGRRKVDAVRAHLQAMISDPALLVDAHDFSIPMPGHAHDDMESDMKLTEDVETLSRLVQACDVMFLVTDSRESRWLPAILGRWHHKTVVTVALGFDDFLVNLNRYDSAGSTNDDDMVGNYGGCYFCSDPTSLPGDSLTRRPLDLACTVTRPGLSSMAAGLAVELVMSSLFLNANNKVDDDLNGGQSEHMNRVTTHAGMDMHIRGGFSQVDDGSFFALRTYRPSACPECCACGDRVLRALHLQGPKFLGRCLRDLPGEYGRLHPQPSSHEHQGIQVDLETF